MRTQSATIHSNIRTAPLFAVLCASIFVAGAFFVGLHVLPVRSLSLLSYLSLAMIALTAVLTWQPKLFAPFVIVSVFFSPDIVVAQIPGRDVNLRVEDGIIVAALLALVIRHAAGRQRLSIPRSPLDKPILAYCAIGFASTLLGSYVGNMSAVRGLFFFGKRLEYFVLFYILYTCLESKKDIKTAINLVFICLLLVSLYNIYMRSTEAGVEQLRGYGPPGVVESWDYADMITLIFPIMLAIAIETGSAWYIALAAISSGPMVFMLLDSLVRHAYVGGAVSVLFLAVHRYRLLLPVMAGATIYTAARLPQRIIQRINFLWLEVSQYYTTGTFVPGGSFICRIYGFREAISNFLYRPLVGRGLGSYGMGSNVSHTQYSQVLLETGLLGLGAFLWLIFSAVRYAFRCVKVTPHLLHRGFAIGYIAGLVGWLVANTASIAFSAIRTMELFITMTAILMVCLKKDTVSA